MGVVYPIEIDPRMDLYDNLIEGLLIHYTCEMNPGMWIVHFLIID